MVGPQFVFGPGRHPLVDFDRLERPVVDQLGVHQVDLDFTPLLRGALEKRGQVAIMAALDDDDDVRHQRTTCFWVWTGRSRYSGVRSSSSGSPSSSAASLAMSSQAGPFRPFTSRCSSPVSASIV